MKSVACSMCSTTIEIRDSRHLYCTTCSNLIRRLRLCITDDRDSNDGKRSSGISNVSLIPIVKLYRETQNCFYCGQSFSTERPKQLDHKISRARGGTNEIDNISIACASCNHSKSGSSIDEWISVCARVLNANPR